MSASLFRPEDADEYKPRHSWPRECNGEKCAQHPIAHRPRHRAEVDA